MATPPKHAPIPWRTCKGSRFELVAAAWLRLHGLRLLERNYRCRFGELDLVMLDGEVLVFVEVRYRIGNDYGSAVDTIDSRKQQRLWHAARHFLLHRSEHAQRPCRFDVLGICGRLPRYNFQWLTNVFV